MEAYKLMVGGREENGNIVVREGRYSFTRDFKVGDTTLRDRIDRKMAKILKSITDFGLDDSELGPLSRKDISELTEKELSIRMLMKEYEEYATNKVYNDDKSRYVQMYEIVKVELVEKH